MNENFKIVYQWEKRTQSLPFSEDDYVDATKLFLSLRHFLSDFQGKFTLHVGRLELDFDIGPDLSTVFEELPSVLEQLTTETQTPVELYFFEQGTDLMFLLQRQGEIISLWIEKKSSVGVRFANIPNRVVSISATDFLKEWIQFIKAVLNSLLDLDPTLMNDESYQMYLKRLFQIQSRT